MWEPLLAPLEAAGHVVVAPTLSGMGGTPEELSAVTLEGWGSEIATLCRTAAPPVVLCGHSRGGIVISTAAEMAPDAVSALVYICAMLIPGGMSRAEFKSLAQPNPAFDAIVRPLPGVDATEVDPERAVAVFAQRSPIALAEANMRRLLAEPNAPRRTPLKLSAECFGSVPRHYVECLHDRTIPIADQRLMQAMQPCVSVTALDADHSPSLSAPAALAVALLGIAEGATG